MLCPACRQENEPGCRRCPSCGLPLATGGRRAPPSSRPPDLDGVHQLGEDTPEPAPVAAVRPDPVVGYLGAPRVEAIGDRTRFRPARRPFGLEGRQYTVLLGITLGARGGAAVAAVLGLIASLLALGMYQADSPRYHFSAIFLVYFLSCLGAGLLGGVVIGALTALLRNLSLAWVIGVPLGILYWGLAHLPLLGISTGHVSAGVLAGGLGMFGLAGGGFGHLVGRSIASALHRWS